MKNRKSMFKKTIALAVALVMCVTMLPTAAFATATEVPDLVISDAAGLIAFAEEVNNGESYSDMLVELSADINLNGAEFTPIGNWNSFFSSNPFEGTFDGKGFAIKNATIRGYGNNSNGVIRAGLFGYVSGGTVRNLTLDNIDVYNESTSNSTMSYLQDYMETASGIAVATLFNGTVDHVTTTRDSSVTGYLRTGGIVGDTRGTSAVVSNCTNNAVVIGNNMYTGGIVGAAHDVSTNLSDWGTTIDTCINAREVTAENQTNVGGIVGYADRAKVLNCENSGTITGKGNYGTGGIMGCAALNTKRTIMGETPHASQMDSCENSGTIVGGRAGGILGAYVLAPSLDAPSVTIPCVINNCSNTGDITGTPGVCGAFYGKTITYKTGADPATMPVQVTGTQANSGTVNGYNPGTNLGPITNP